MRCGLALVAALAILGCGDDLPGSGEDEATPEGALRITRDMTDFDARITAGAPGPHCADVVEVPGTVLCGWFGRDRMNGVLGRASMYAEGFGTPKGNVVGRSSRELADSSPAMAAHDLQGEHLLQFWKDVARACTEKGPDFCASEEERAFFETTILPRKGGPRFAVLGFNAETAQAPFRGVSHELCHARYFLEASYTRAVDAYWDGLEASEQDEIRERLASSGYDRNNDYLMRNEFQAYTLQAYGSDAEIGEWRAHREPLQGALAAAKVPALVVR